jgi:hypothetical protein
LAPPRPRVQSHCTITGRPESSGSQQDLIKKQTLLAPSLHEEGRIVVGTPFRRSPLRRHNRKFSQAFQGTKLRIAEAITNASKFVMHA